MKRLIAVVLLVASSFGFATTANASWDRTPQLSDAEYAALTSQSGDVQLHIGDRIPF